MDYVLTPISKCVKKVSTWNPKQEPDAEDFPYVDLSSVDKESKNIALERVELVSPADAPSRARQLIVTGDVLVSTVRPNLNGVALVTKELDGATASTGYCVLRPEPTKLDSRYLFYWVQSPNFVESMMMQATGANYPAVSDRIVKQSEIPLPPLAEQKRIAAILDKADALRRKRQQAIDLADQFLRSVFLDMFGDPVTNPKGWPRFDIASLSLRVTKGESPKWQGFGYQDAGVRFVTSENVLWGRLDERRKYIPDEFHHKLKRSALNSRDLLVNLVGASVGRACLYPDNGEPANINQAVAVTTFDSDKILPEFALVQVLLPSVQHELLGNVVDAARANISLKNIRELALLAPDIEEQYRYFRIVKQYDAKMHKLGQAHAEGELLFHALSQQAFSGQL